MSTEALEFYRDMAGEHRWRLKGANGEIITASSEGFTWRSGAVRNAILAADRLAAALKEQDL